MEFVEAITHSNVLNKVCLLSLEDGNESSEAVENDTGISDNNNTNKTSQVNHKTVDGAISDDSENEYNILVGEFCQINLNDDIDVSKTPPNKNNCTIGTMTDTKFKEEPNIKNDTLNENYELMLIGKFNLSFHLDDIIEASDSKNHENNITKDHDKTVKIEDNKQKSTIKGFHIPQNFEIRSAIGYGDCFFDSFRQGLQQLGITVSINELRSNCKEFAENNPQEWFVTAIGNSFQHSGIRKETVPQYIENIQTCDRWGDPDIEGRILCEYHKVSLYVIEKQQAANVEMYMSQIINSNGCKCVTNIDFDKENTIFIINQGQGHFEPIIRIENQNCQFTPTDLDQTLTSDKFKIQSGYSQQEISCSHIKGYQTAIERFSEIENAIKEGNLEQLNDLIQLLYQASDKSLLADMYKDKNNKIRETHLITIACKYNQPNILDFLLHKSNILCYLPSQGPMVDRAYVQALCFVMKSYDISMLESLYNYWCGDFHWLGCGNDSNIDSINITNLERLNRLLVKSRDDCYKCLIKHQQMLVDVHCLINFNSFQIELYTELIKLKTESKQIIIQNDNDLRKFEVESTIAVLMTAFNVYEKYSNKNIRLTKHLEQDKIKLELLFQEGSLYMKYWAYIMYELYYRKLDYSIALLIINNLHLLKLRLKLENDTYQDIEATLYYYLYRVNEDWKLYLPENRPKCYNSVLGRDIDGLIQPVKVLYDPHRIYNGPVIYLEWRKFRKSLSKFKAALENINIDNIRPKGTDLPIEEINNLSLLPYLRDDYSLKKILEYLEQVTYLDIKHDKVNTMLIIERIIQITGEFFKSTPDTFHLSPNTLALLRMEIPKITYKCIFDIRDDISHARDGKLIKRIDLENSEYSMFAQILEDLKELKKAITKVIQVYKTILKKSLLRLGLSLIEERRNEIPEEATFFSQIIYTISQSFEDYGYEVYMIFENSFLNDKWKNLGFTRQLFREIACLSKNSVNLHKQWQLHDIVGIKILKNKIPTYLQSILQTTDLITEHNKIWEIIKEDIKKITPPLTLSVLNYPNKTCIQNIKTALKTVRKKDKTEIMNKISNIKDWDIEWIEIKEMMSYMVIKMGIFSDHHWEIKRSLYTNTCKTILKSFPDNEGVQNVIWLVKSITCYLEISASVQSNDESNKYDGIQTLANLMKKSKFFITNREMDYIKNNTLNLICDCRAKTCEHKKILEKVYDNTFISEKDYETITSININEKCKKIIECLTNGIGRDNDILECLVNRVSLLYTLFEGEKELKNLILRYKQDVQFRIAFEMIVSDIMNTFAEGWLGELVNTSYSKLLSEYPLRNLLEHGNPLLDIGGVTLDENDFPSALIKFALDVLEDKSYLNDLLELKEDGVDRADVKADSSDNLNKKQNLMVKIFKSNCNKWKSYVKLLPTTHTTAAVGQKKKKKKPTQTTQTYK